MTGPRNLLPKIPIPWDCVNPCEPDGIETDVCGRAQDRARRHFTVGSNASTFADASSGIFSGVACLSRQVRLGEGSLVLIQATRCGSKDPSLFPRRSMVLGRVFNQINKHVDDVRVVSRPAQPDPTL
jgi:hypothetical protein